MELQHFSHEHLLVFIQEQNIATEEQACCFGCGKVVNGPSYCCNEYVNCASLEPSITEDFPNSLHKHSLIFVQNHKDEVNYNCAGCQKPLSGPIYHGLNCPNFYLHKECAELPLKINHPYDSIHPLTFLPEPAIHPEECCCYLCKIKWEGFVYCCSLCEIELTVEDVCSPRTITAASQEIENPWMLLSRQMSFICDFCGTSGDRTLYVGTTSTRDFLVHKNCISLPRNFMITRHVHMISHSYSLQQKRFEDWNCRICYGEVNKRYGGYYCSTSNCNFIAHVNCATDKEIWDGTIVLKDEDERSKEALEESMNLITNVIEQRSTGGDLVATKIKHAYHDHNLIFRDKIKDDDNCDGCMRPLSTPFYSCDQCNFFLHKNCVELPRKIRHPFHKHLLTLTKGRNNEDEILLCSVCKHLHHGFSYQCLESCSFEIDIQCSLQSDILKHASHEHPLVFDHNCRGKCGGCLGEIYSLAYRCTRSCDFILDLWCGKLPLTAWYKYDKHLLTLAYYDDSDPCQHYCDLCEKKRVPNHWYYYCAHCDNSLHSNCALGDFPFIKLGSKVKGYLHKHPLTFVKNIWNCPRCKVCCELCNAQTLECKESECNFSVHMACYGRFRSTVRLRQA